MRLLRTRVISFILVLSLCISMWSPVGATVVVAEGNATTDSSGTDTGNTDSGDSTDTGNTGDSGTTGDSSDTESSENITGYSIMLEDEKGNVITSIASGSELNLKDSLKVRKTEGDEIVDVEGGTFEYSSSDENVATVSTKDGEDYLVAKQLATEQSVNLSVTWTMIEENNSSGTESETTTIDGEAGGTDSAEPEPNVITVTQVFSIVVRAAQITGVQISGKEKTSKTMIVNETYNLAADVSVVPSVVAKELIYTSSDATVVSIDENGSVKALKATSVDKPITITVTSKQNENVKATMDIEVIDIPVSMTLNKSAHSMKATDTFQIEATIVYASGKEEKITDTSKLKFNIIDEQVAKVDEKGLVTGLEQSSYPVTTLVQVSYQFPYTYDGENRVGLVSNTCQITVTKIPVEQVIIENEIDSITLKINDEYTLKSHVLPTNATNQTVSYKSSDKDVAKVSSSGVITATGIGEATITAYTKDDSSVKDTFKVKVFQTTFDVKELGVDGTDKSNDATELNKILWYATKIDEPITVVIPDGTYYIGKTLKVYTQTNLVLSDNAVIKRMQSAGDKHMLINRTDEDTNGYDQCSDIVITGGVWDGNATGENSANCMYFGHAKNITITDTIIKNNSGAHLIELAGVKNVLVENVELYGYTMCKEKGYTAAQADKEAIQIDYCSSVSAPAMKPYDGTACDTVTIRNCNIHDYMAGVGTHTEGGKASTNVRIENNTFTNITNACVNLRKFENVNILNNTAKNCTTFVYASNSQGIIKDNKANIGTSYKPKTSSGLRAKNGITISNGSSFTIEKNTFEKAKSNGICIWNGSTATIKNNKLKNNKLYGIRTQGSTITLKKNSFSKNKKGVYDTYKDAKIKSSDDIRAYYIDIKKSYKYKGKAVKPKIKIKNLNKKYYKVSYKNTNKPGTATVIIKGKGKVKQTLKIKYKIKK